MKSTLILLLLGLSILCAGAQDRVNTYTARLRVPDASTGAQATVSNDSDVAAGLRVSPPSDKIAGYRICIFFDECEPYGTCNMFARICEPDRERFARACRAVWEVPDAVVFNEIVDVEEEGE